MLYSIAEITRLRDEKVTAHNLSLSYYDGTRNPVYLNDRLQSFFSQNVHYKENWLPLTVNAVLNKLLIEGFTVGAKVRGEADDPRAQKMNAMWDALQMASEADLVHEFAHSTGEGFIIADEDSNNNIVSYANDPRCVYVVYGGEDPREITQAVKFWLDGSTHKATSWSLQNGQVFIETLTGAKTTQTDKTLAQNETGLSYTSDGKPAVTKFARIPVFHFRRSARNVKPEFYQVQAIQDSINKTFVALGFSIENASDRIRWAVTNADMEAFKDARAGDVVAIPPGSQYEQPVTVGEFTPADLKQLSSLISDWKSDIASITLTPAHYLLSDNGVPALSGEALQALEAPLVAKVKRYVRRYAAVWESWAAFMLSLSGSPTTTDEVTCHYADPRTSLANSTATVRELNVRAGMPLISQLREEGYRQSEIDQILADRVTESGTTMDDAAREAVYDKMGEKAAATMEPMLKTALKMISDAATAELIGNPALIDKIVAAKAPAAETPYA